MFDFSDVWSATVTLLTQAQTIIDPSTFWGGAVALMIGVMLVFYAASQFKRLVMRH